MPRFSKESLLALTEFFSQPPVIEDSSCSLPFTVEYPGPISSKTTPREIQHDLEGQAVLDWSRDGSTRYLVADVLVKALNDARIIGTLAELKKFLKDHLFDGVVKEHQDRFFELSVPHLQQGGLLHNTGRILSEEYQAKLNDIDAPYHLQFSGEVNLFPVVNGIAIVETEKLSHVHRRVGGLGDLTSEMYLKDRYSPVEIISYSTITFDEKHDAISVSAITVQCNIQNTDIAHLMQCDILPPEEVTLWDQGSKVASTVLTVAKEYGYGWGTMLGGMVGLLEVDEQSVVGTRVKDLAQALKTTLQDAVDKVSIGIDQLSSIDSSVNAMTLCKRAAFDCSLMIRLRYPDVIKRRVSESETYVDTIRAYKGILMVLENKSGAAKTQFLAEAERLQLALLETQSSLKDLASHADKIIVLEKKSRKDGDGLTKHYKRQRRRIEIQQRLCMSHIQTIYAHQKALLSDAEVDAVFVRYEESLKQAISTLRTCLRASQGDVLRLIEREDDFRMRGLPEERQIFSVHALLAYQWSMRYLSLKKQVETLKNDVRMMLKSIDGCSTLQSIDDIQIQTKPLKTRAVVLENGIEALQAQFISVAEKITALSEHMEGMSLDNDRLSDSLSERDSVIHTAQSAMKTEKEAEKRVFTSLAVAELSAIQISVPNEEPLFEKKEDKTTVNLPF